MKHLKRMNEAKEISRKKLAEQLIQIFEEKYRSHPSSGRFVFQWESNLNEAEPGKVVSQYGDIFFILPRSIRSLHLPIVEILLGAPFRGDLYASQQDMLLQVRVSGFIKIPTITNNTEV